MRGNQGGAIVTVLFVGIIVMVVLTIGTVARNSYEQPATASTPSPTIASSTGR